MSDEALTFIVILLIYTKSDMFINKKCIPFWLTKNLYSAIIINEKKKDLSAATNKPQVIDNYLHVVSYHFLFEISRKEDKILWEF